MDRLVLKQSQMFFRFLLSNRRKTIWLLLLTRIQIGKRPMRNSPVFYVANWRGKSVIVGFSGEDESLFRASLVWTIPDLRCEFANVCRRALSLLHIPGMYVIDWYVISLRVMVCSSLPDCCSVSEEYLETTGKCFCPHCLCTVVRMGKDSPTVAEGWYRHPIRLVIFLYCAAMLSGITHTFFRLSRHNVVSAESLSSAKVRAFQGVKVHHSRRIFDAYRATYKSGEWSPLNTSVSL